VPTKSQLVSLFTMPTMIGPDVLLLAWMAFPEWSCLGQKAGYFSIPFSIAIEQGQAV
jgi:hypothetical protein